MRLLRPLHSGIFLRSFRLHSTHYAKRIYRGQVQMSASSKVEMSA